MLMLKLAAENKSVLGHDRYHMSPVHAGANAGARQVAAVQASPAQATAQAWRQHKNDLDNWIVVQHLDLAAQCPGATTHNHTQQTTTNRKYESPTINRQPQDIDIYSGICLSILPLYALPLCILPLYIYQTTMIITPRVTIMVTMIMTMMN